MLGGNLATRRLEGGGEIDVYPHMYLEWYVNFWQLMEDVGVERETSFRPFDSVYQLRRRNETPHWSKLTNAYAPQYVPENLFGRRGSAARHVHLRVRVRGPARRAGMADGTARKHEPHGVHGLPPVHDRHCEQGVGNVHRPDLGPPGTLGSAKDAQTYLRYCLPAGDARQWLTRDSAEASFVSPLRRALEREGVEIVTSTKLDRGRGGKGPRDGDRAPAQRLRPARVRMGRYRAGMARAADELMSRSR